MSPAVASPPFNPILATGALELADLIARREVSPTEVVEAHLARIEEVNRSLNAIVALRADAARAEARQAERTLLQGKPLGPLHGVPFTAKEIIAVKGMPWTCGSPLRRGVVAGSDATVIERVRRAGAILLGVTNLPEMACWMETGNCVYGRTNNPHDLRRTPGGSSGGEAAIVASGGSAFGVGSDGAGSIRMPALFCGLFGHKPTGGLIPTKGHYPFVGEEGGWSETQRYVTIGPLTRRAADLLPLVGVMAGQTSAEIVSCCERPARYFRDRAVLVLEDPRIRWASRSSDEMRAVVRRAAGVLGQHGAVVTEWSHASIRDALVIWTATFEEQFGRTLEDVLGQGRRLSLVTELLRWGAGRTRHTLPALLFCLGERVGRRSKVALARLAAHGRQLRADLEAALDGGALIMPAHPRVAPRHGSALLRPIDWAYTALWNALELPATSIPLGRSKSGLPLGLQVIAARGGDATTIAVARLLEETGVSSALDAL